MGKLKGGDNSANNFKLFTKNACRTGLCTFVGIIHALYKHWFQNPKALKKKNKSDLYTVHVKLYLLQLLLSSKK